MTPPEIQEAMRRLSNERRAAQKWYEEEERKASDAEMTYRQEKGTRWVKTEAGTVAERQVLVDASTAELKFEADLADRMGRVAREKVRGVLQEMSLLQTYMAYERAVTDLHRHDEGDG